jgi:dipeptidyl aminopeptidase/acylaminoacyl peptidase
VWLADGHLIFEQDEPPPLYSVNLWTVRIDPKSGRALGKPEKSTNWFGFVPWYVSVSRDGSRFAMVKARDWYDAYLAELPSGAAQISPPKRLSSGENFDYPSDWSPDSKSFLFYSNRNQRFQIFRQQLDNDSAELLIPGSSDWNLGVPTYSPDGASILYWTFRRGSASSQLMKLPVSGGTPGMVFETTPTPMASFECPRAPATSCVLSRLEHGRLVFYAVDTDHGLGKELASTEISNAHEILLDLTVDGTQVAISSDQLTGKIRFLDFITHSQRDLALPSGITIRNFSWAADGKSLIAATLQGDRYHLVEIKLDGTIHPFWDAGKHELDSLTASPNGRYLAFAYRTLENNVWLLDNSLVRSHN